MISKFKCPCCGNLTLSEERMFEICDVCGWEDDNVQFDNPDFAGGANFFSLNKYRELYLQGKDIQKCEEEAKHKQEKY
mgnify:CR=1 FL=1